MRTIFGGWNFFGSELTHPYSFNVEKMWIWGFFCLSVLVVFGVLEAYACVEIFFGCADWFVVFFVWVRFFFNVF